MDTSKMGGGMQIFALADGFGDLEPAGGLERPESLLARPERLELPTYWFEASCSIHLSYGRAASSYHQERAHRN
jgi:hypothetical protein